MITIIIGIIVLVIGFALGFACTAISMTGLLYAGEMYIDDNTKMIEEIIFDKALKDIPNVKGKAHKYVIFKVVPHNTQAL